MIGKSVKKAKNILKCFKTYQENVILLLLVITVKTWLLHTQRTQVILNCRKLGKFKFLF